MVLNRIQSAERFGVVLCFEMDAASPMNSLSCIVKVAFATTLTRKNKKWQAYAVRMAAVCGGRPVSYTLRSMGVGAMDDEHTVT